MRNSYNFGSATVSRTATLGNKGRRCVRRLGGVVAITVLGALGPEPAAEFYVFFDGEGRRHVSNIPAYGFTARGAIKSPYDPNSIVYQHGRLREDLTRQAEDIALRREREQISAELPPEIQQTQVLRRAPREGIMNLDELIELEKRGGRHEGSPTGESSGPDPRK